MHCATGHRARRRPAGAERLDRLRRTVIEASKQCGRNRLMEIRTPVRARELFHHVPSTAARLLGDAAGQPMHVAKICENSSIHVAIGPEGGFAREELAAAKEAGWQCVSIGQPNSARRNGGRRRGLFDGWYRLLACLLSSWVGGPHNSPDFPF